MFWAKKIFLALNRKERLVFFGALGAIVLSFLVLGGIYINKNTIVVPAYGGTYTEGMVGQPAYVNPVLATSDVDKNLVRLIFSNLSDLSDTIESDKTGKVWRVRIKDNIFWSDGQKLTSDDVIFTVDRIQDANSNSPLLGNWQGVKVNRVSQLEITFELANPYIFFKDNLQGLYIIPKHIFADVPAANWRLSEYNLKPVGSGPYVFAGFDKRQDGFILKYSLEDNATYFAPRPHINNFNISFFPKMDDLIKSFNSGQVDGLGDVDPKSLSSILRSYNLDNFTLPSYYAVFLNQSGNIALQDQKVRQALSVAIDRNALVSSVLNGNGSPETGPIPPVFYSLGITPPNPTSSLDYSNQILDSAGWKMNGDFREKTINKNVVQLGFKLTVPQIQFLMDTAQNLADTWKKIGVNVEIQTISPADILDQTIKNRDYESLLLGNSLNSGPDLFSFWHSSERFYPGLNLSIYNNPSVDSLIESVRQNSNPDTRTAQLQNLENTIYGDYPAIFLYSPDYVYLTAKSLKGLAPGFISEPANRFLGIESWYLQTARVFK